jgi:hypothetical protein
MRLLLPKITMPSDLNDLLKENVSQQILNPEHLVVKAIRKNRPLQIILEDSFRSIDENQLGLEKMMSAFGWNHFKLRWCSIYIFKTIFDFYPNEIDLDLVADIEAFEQRFQGLSAVGHSRVFLLGFYLKLINLHYKKNNPEVSDDEWFIPELVDNICRDYFVKSEKPDWLILTLWHFVKFLGVDKVKPFLSQPQSYQLLFAYLTEPQRYQLVNNLLVYGASISEPQFFLYEKV